jgi:hypothetical protein
MPSNRVQIVIRGDDDGGWFLDHVGGRHLPGLQRFSGPYASRSEAAHAITEYRRRIEAALGRPR